MNLLLLSLGRTSQAHSEVSSQEIQGWLDAVVLLTNNGAFCSGALIDEEGTVLTAYHCVASREADDCTNTITADLSGTYCGC